MRWQAQLRPTVSMYRVSSSPLTRWITREGYYQEHQWNHFIAVISERERWCAGDVTATHRLPAFQKYHDRIARTLLSVMIEFLENPSHHHAHSHHIKTSTLVAIKSRPFLLNQYCRVPPWMRHFHLRLCLDEELPNSFETRSNKACRLRRHHHRRNEIRPPANEPFVIFPPSLCHPKI